MQGKVHVAIGVGCLACVCLKYPTGFEMAGAQIIPEISLITAAFGSYLPDIDQSRTHMGQKHKVTSKVVNKVGGGHRGITHTLLFPALLLALSIFCTSYFADYYALQMITCSLIYGVTFGYIMHIFADLFNGKGCPLFWPIMRGKIHIMDLPSSGTVPWIFAVVLIVCFATVLFVVPSLL